MDSETLENLMQSPYQMKIDQDEEEPGFTISFPDLPGHGKRRYPGYRLFWGFN